MNKMTLITCTGGRPGSFALVEKWMAEQSYQNFEWIVVDDCEPHTKMQMGQLVVRPEPWLSTGLPSMTRNLMRAADLVDVGCKKIAFIEDDECYLPNHLANMNALLEESPLVGEAPARYYHLPTQQYRHMGNLQHASLCQTAIRRELLTRVTELCTGNGHFVDVHLWAAVAGQLTPSKNVVSMKGLPGRPGIGVGHRPTGGAWQPDPNYDLLTRWIGENRVQDYRALLS